MTMSRTENGALTHSTSGSHLLDLFFNFGAARGNTAKLADMFYRSFMNDPELTLRVALWGRDVRGGAGEREAFRAILKALDSRVDFDDVLLSKIAEVGRADDLLTVTRNFDVVAKFYKKMIDSSELSGLFAKWAPRQGPVANALRKAWKLGSPKNYRKYVVERTDVVEQKMCGHDWTSVNYEHVPSVAMARYNAAFGRNDAARFADYKTALQNGEAKINASAVFPHDIVRTGRGYGANEGVIQAQWEALPNFIGEGKGILPMSDVSGSMDQKISGSVTAMDVSIALGLYISERQKGPFKDVVLTFSSDPQFHKVTGDTIVQRINNLSSADWGMSTDLQKAFDKILDVAVKNNVPAADMPEYLVILSDMEFNVASRHSTNHDAAAAKFKRAGYALPKIVYWNLASRTKNVPVTLTTEGTALVSGFSPSIMKTVLEADKFDPMSMMLDVIMNPRYDVKGWTA